MAEREPINWPVMIVLWVATITALIVFGMALQYVEDFAKDRGVTVWELVKYTALKVVR